MRLFMLPGTAVSSMLIAPSVSPWRALLDNPTIKTPPHNPALRQVFFDAATHELLDYEQFTMDLDRVSLSLVNDHLS